MIGMAVGAAIEGMRPIVEMQFADFSSVAFNQIVNQAATHFYRTGVPIPITVRLPSGGTPGSGPFHSQSMEGIYAQYPGLVVLTPATVSDAYHMLIDGVALDDPVIFCEHKFLYRWLKAKSINGDHLPIGQARIIRPGKHATVVAYSAMVHEAVRAADRLQQDGWEIEVVDLRSVKPLDLDTILASVARTGRLLAVGEAFPWGGVTAEVISRVTEEGFHLLDAPPQRLNARDTPVPYHPKLWAAHRPTPESICEALAQTAHFLIPAFQNFRFSASTKMPTVPILMPQLGESIAEATVVRLGIAVGDSVRTDQEIIEVETNKAVMGVTTLCDGVVSELRAQEGISYSVGTLLGLLGSDGGGSRPHRSRVAGIHRGETHRLQPVEQPGPSRGQPAFRTR